MAALKSGKVGYEITPTCHATALQTWLRHLCFLFKALLIPVFKTNLFLAAKILNYSLQSRNLECKHCCIASHSFDWNHLVRTYHLSHLYLNGFALQTKWAPIKQTYNHYLIIQQLHDDCKCPLLEILYLWVAKSYRALPADINPFVKNRIEKL